MKLEVFIVFVFVLWLVRSSCLLITLLKCSKVTSLWRELQDKKTKISGNDGRWQPTRQEEEGSSPPGTPPVSFHVSLVFSPPGTQRQRLPLSNFPSSWIQTATCSRIQISGPLEAQRVGMLAKFPQIPSSVFLISVRTKWDKIKTALSPFSSSYLRKRWFWQSSWLDYKIPNFNPLGHVVLKGSRCVSWSGGLTRRNGKTNRMKTNSQRSLKSICVVTPISLREDKSYLTTWTLKRLG